MKFTKSKRGFGGWENVGKMMLVLIILAVAVYLIFGGKDKVTTQLAVLEGCGNLPGQDDYQCSCKFNEPLVKDPVGKFDIATCPEGYVGTPSGDCPLMKSCPENSDGLKAMKKSLRKSNDDFEKELEEWEDEGFEKDLLTMTRDEQHIIMKEFYGLCCRPKE